MRSNGKKLSTVRIEQAVRATSAAPTYFKLCHVTDEEKDADFIDGGAGYNNPAMPAYEDGHEQGISPGARRRRAGWRLRVRYSRAGFPRRGGRYLAQWPLKVSLLKIWLFGAC